MLANIVENYIKENAEYKDFYFMLNLQNIPEDIFNIIEQWYKDSLKWYKTESIGGFRRVSISDKINNYYIFHYEDCIGNGGFLNFSIL